MANNSIIDLKQIYKIIKDLQKWIRRKYINRKMEYENESPYFNLNGEPYCIFCWRSFNRLVRVEKLNNGLCKCDICKEHRIYSEELYHRVFESTPDDFSRQLEEMASYNPKF